MDANGKKDVALTTSVSVFIYVVDVNDRVPTFSSLHYNFTVDEHADLMSEVGVVSVSDGDINSTDSIRFRILSGADWRVFIENQGSEGNRIHTIFNYSENKMILWNQELQKYLRLETECIGLGFLFVWLVLGFFLFWLYFYCSLSM